MRQLHQSVAVITGAGSGIGRSTSITLAKAGFRVVLVGRREHTLHETGQQLADSGVDWLSIRADIGESDDRQRVIDQTIEQFGRLDVLVNNAAIGTCKPLAELNEDEIRQLYEINAVGPTDFVRRALPELIKTKGCVVNIASVAILDPFVGLGVYGCTKAAIDGLTRAIHNEYHDQEIRAYTIAPGAVETDMLRSIVSEDLLPSANTLSAEQVADKIIACITGKASEPSGSTIVMNSP